MPTPQEIKFIDGGTGILRSSKLVGCQKHNKIYELWNRHLACSSKLVDNDTTYEFILTY
jgi:hypothetical protein